MITALIRRKLKKFKRPLLWLRDRPYALHTIFFVWWHGIDASPCILFLGSPRLSLYRRGTLKVGRNFRGISDWKRNSIGIAFPLTIKTNTPDAVISIGDNCGISGAVLSARKRITIGNNVFIGSGAMIIDSDMHDLCGVDSHLTDALIVSHEVKIGDSAFIGARAIILKGVNIGEGAVVGAGATVSKDVPPYTVVVCPSLREIPRVLK